MELVASSLFGRAPPQQEPFRDEAGALSKITLIKFVGYNRDG